MPRFVRRPSFVLLLALSAGWVSSVHAGYRSRVVATSAVTDSVAWLGFTYTDALVLEDRRVLFAAADGDPGQPGWFDHDNAVWLAAPGGEPQLLVREGMDMPQFPGDTYGALFYVRRDVTGGAYVEASRSGNLMRAASLRLGNGGLVPWFADGSVVTAVSGNDILRGFADPAYNGGQAFLSGSRNAEGLFLNALFRVYDTETTVTYITGGRDPMPGEPTSEIQDPDLAISRNGNGDEAFILYGEEQDGFTLFRSLFRRPSGGDPVLLERSVGNFVNNPVEWESLHLDAAGNLYVEATRYDSTGVWLYPAGQAGPPQPVLLVGQDSPGIDFSAFTAVGGIAPRNDGSVLVFAEVDINHPQSGQPWNGIWHWKNGVLTKLVSTTDPVPGFPAGSQFRAIGGGLANGTGNLAFPAEVDDAGFNYLGEGVWAGNDAGWSQVLQLGESFEVAPGVNRLVTQINMVGSPYSYVLVPPFLQGGSQDGLGGAMNEAGAFCVEIRHSGGSTLVVFEPALVVNSTAWTSDQTPGNGECDTGNFIDGMPECTWLAAIEEANASTGPDRILFDIPGTDPNFQDGAWTITPTNSPPAVTDPVTIDGTSQPGYVGDPLVFLAGNDIQMASNEPGIRLDTDDSTVRGVGVGGFGGPGIHSAGARNRVEACFVGLAPGGILPNGNLQDGILVLGPDTVVGTVGAGNVVAANGQSSTGGNQIVVTGAAATGAIIRGNLVGTDFTGLGTLPGSTYGIQVDAGADGAVIGGAGAGEGNLVAGMQYGIAVRQAGDASIRGNLVGLDITRTNALPNAGSGIELVDASGTVVGGETATPGTGAGNVIAGNTGDGIRVSGSSSGVRIHGNVIGLASANGDAIPNGGRGVLVQDASGVWIGDSASPPTANVISGNAAGGILLQGGGDHRVAHARVGTGNDPGVARGNQGPGLQVVGSNDALLEDLVVGENFGDGVYLETSDGTLLQDSQVFRNFGAGARIPSGVENEIRATTFEGNFGLGIDLGDPGVLANDAGDADSGANGLQNAPFLVRAERISPGDPVTVNGYLVSAPNTQYTLAFLANTACDPSGYGEGTALWQEISVLTDGSGVAAFAEVLPAVAEGFLSATATDPAGNTSEFSNCLSIDPLPDATFSVNSTGDTGDANPGDGTCDTGGPLVDGLPECTLRAILEETNALPGIEEIGFAIPGAGPYVIQPATALPVITGTVSLDGRTQAGYAGFPVIRIDGASAGSVDGLTVEGPGCTVRALEIGGFTGAGVVFRDAAGGLLRGCVVGTAPGGAFGGAAATAANEGAGVLLDNANDVFLGAPGLTEGNVIAANGGDGIRVLSGSGNGFVNNELTGNGELAVDLVGGTENPDGITANDALDADSGPNGLQNFPVLTAAEVVNGLLTASGSASGVPSTEVQVDVYADDACDPSGAGEGARYLGRVGMILDGAGSGVFLLSTSVEALGVDDATAASWFLSATATGPEGTSEFSACLSPELVPVVLATFTAVSEEGGVRLAWSTSEETRHLGFHVFRRDGGAAEWIRLTDDLVAGGPDYVYLDPGAPAGRESEYSLEAWARDGSHQRLGRVRVFVDARPAVLALRAAANPFRAAGTLVFDLPEPVRVRLEIVAVTGRRIATLVDGFETAGEHRVTWDGIDIHGRRVAAGSYFAVLTTPGESRTLQLVVLR